MAVPKIIPYNVELRSVNPVRSFDRPKAYTNDLNSVEFQFKILDMTSTELSTATAVTLIYMRDGSFFANPSTDVSRVGNVFSYLLKENEGNHAGVAKIQLVVTVDDMELASQLFDFEIINGLETQVAQEIMIYDWTMLTREARDYIDQFVADELLRDAEFDNNEFDRNTAFQAGQTTRTNTFNADQTTRTTAFNDAQNARTNAYAAAEADRDADFGEAEGLRATGETGRVSAESIRVTAETGRTNAESNRVTAETNRVTAESGRVTAESGRVTAESDRVTTFAGYNARITGVESDVNANATNLVTNGDFSTGSAPWVLGGTSEATLYTLDSKVGTNSIRMTSTNSSSIVAFDVEVPVGNIVYVGVWGKLLSFTDGVYVDSILTAHDSNAYTNVVEGRLNKGLLNIWQYVSLIKKATTSAIKVMGGHVGYTTRDLLVDGFISIDLTATFGAGNEPTAEQMDRLLTQFPNSWFDGTDNLFQAKASLNKLMVVDARTEFDAVNLVANGDLSNGTNRWEGNADYSTISASSGILSVTSKSSGWNIAQQKNMGIHKTGNKLYVRARMKNATGGVILSIRRGTGATELASVFDVTADTWYTVSGIWDTTSYSGAIDLRFDKYGKTVSGDVLQIQYVSCIDLTALFGAGKEPTLAEMDRLMARFPNSWFDGAKPIQTIETLYQEKANKAQEAWITPTLLNGWSDIPEIGQVGYYKDALGTVHFRGIIGNGNLETVIFNLPVGYRPATRVRYSVIASNAIGFVEVLTNGEVRDWLGGTSWVSLDSITFRAEG